MIDKLVKKILYAALRHWELK